MKNDQSEIQNIETMKIQRFYKMVHNGNREHICDLWWQHGISFFFPDKWWWPKLNTISFFLSAQCQSLPDFLI